MIPVVLATLLAAEPTAAVERRLTYDLTVEGYGGSREASGAELGAGLRGEHLGGRVFLGVGGAGGELSFAGGLAATYGAGRGSSRLELELGAGLQGFTRDEEPDDVDRALVLLGAEETTREVSGSSATLPFAQARAGGAWRLPNTNTWLRLGIYVRVMDRVRVHYVEETCVYALWGSACTQQARSVRYGATSAGVYVNLGKPGTIADPWQVPAPESAGDDPG